MMATVGEHLESFNITQAEIACHAESSDYWQNVQRFVASNWHRNIDFLSPKQLEWLSKIIDGLEEMQLRADSRKSYED